MAFDINERDELRRKLEDYAKSRDRVLRDEIVRAQVGLAEYLARRFKNRGEPIDDLIQVALLGHGDTDHDLSRVMELRYSAGPDSIGIEGYTELAGTRPEPSELSMQILGALVDEHEVDGQGSKVRFRLLKRREST